MGRPLFSIITITFNAAGTLPATLRSVERQTFTDYEYLIVDGASTDGTVAIARHSAAVSSVTSEPDKGLYDAMNKGLRKARGGYLVFLNAGDAFHEPDTLQKIADSIEKNNPDIVYGETALVDSERRFISMRRLQAPERLSVKSFRMGMLVCHQAFIVRREIAPEYDLRYRFRRLRLVYPVHANGENDNSYARGAYRLFERGGHYRQPKGFVAGEIRDLSLIHI